MNAPCPSNQVRITPGPNSWYRKLPVIGPLLDELLGWLRGQGFAESTLRTHIMGISRLFRWLRKRRRSAPDALTESDLQAAYDWFRTRRPGVAAAARALERFLRERQLIPVNDPAPLTPSELELQTHGGYLLQVRGMAESTIQGHQNRFRFFLRFLRFDQRPAAIRTLESDQVDAFLRNRAKTNNCFSLQHIVASVRGFLQRQHAQGVIKQPLHQQIDTPRTYRLEQLPRAIPWTQVIALLRSIDRSEPNSMRDFTILYLAARYGLRSGEVPSLRRKRLHPHS